MVDARIRVRKLYHAFNNTPPATGEDLNDPDVIPQVMGSDRKELIAKIIPLREDQHDKVEVEPPFYWFVLYLAL